SGCNTEQRVDCALSGLICEEGQCSSPPNPDPDPQPEAVEPMPDTVDPDAEDGETPDTTEGPVEDSGPSAEVGAEITPRGVRDDGCAGGGLLSLSPLMLGALAWRSRRRR
ncbi:MAG TPA: hypothetical protein PK095_19770, partial [Myxococcota bacterium]|nr:hypothetical protein [Myxococcota bacterium]